MAGITEKEVLAALSQVQDPELRRDLVSLGMIKDIKIDGSAVAFTVELTTPGVPVCEPRSRRMPKVPCWRWMAWTRSM